ncbi:D-alanyl-D-alanine carboxypeptidase/D-alanyl-D-alanine-endopeptidase [Brevibacterium sp. BRM-1]|uniref:D-alanyl-D-alanine carboxypeptidase/D-alanyl-D-alanine endopeptidase n=1 Tax=Brevibacterium sp. BRM-1 TaxID=2999062 RepID=UPI00227EAEA8|nr:D-alanyl-D-alanine carboxypeptidase/D-alanyl-D-alanine-endopeptidase [Brevibacterium sp. BRM-1]WAL39104.1 D-alanyl-D-alanine carboxypeptidase/D-alanyl-D-alanine-endopeptidase [Brevibacterium sp. BRM-1]
MNGNGFNSEEQPLRSRERPRQRGRRARRRKGRLAVPLTAGIVVLGLVGYGVADAYDTVPGFLTTAPEQVIDPLPEPVAHAGSASAGKRLDADAPVPANIADRLDSALAAKGLKGKVGAEVRDAVTGDVLYSEGAQRQRTPASVTKALTAAAALGRLGAQSTFTTSAALSQSGGTPTLSLVGGGDVLLGAGASQPDQISGRAGLGTLAASTAAALKDKGVDSVRLSADLSRYAKPDFNAGWQRADIAAGYIAPIGPLMIDAARTRPVRNAPREADPAAVALDAFATALEKQGIDVAQAKPAQAAQDSQTLASVQSAPLADVLRYALLESDNVVSEVMGHEVAISMGAEPSEDGAPQAVLDALAGMKLDTGSISLKDTSGLNYGNRISPHDLAGVLRQAAAADGDLSLLVPNMPVGGLSGTLADRFRDAGSKAAAGRVSAKTGTLSTVSSLAGTVLTDDGRLLVFALMADGLPAGSAQSARAVLDRTVSSLSQCGCS